MCVYIEGMVLGGWLILFTSHRNVQLLLHRHSPSQHLLNTQSTPVVLAENFVKNEIIKHNQVLHVKNVHFNFHPIPRIYSTIYLDVYN